MKDRIGMRHQHVTFERSYPYDFDDLSVAFYKTAKNLYGEKAIQGAMLRTFFGLRKTRITLYARFVNIGPEEKTKCTTGPVSIVGLADVIIIGKPAAAGEILAVITVLDAPEEDSKKIEQFLDAIGETLKAGSIYKGKAITAGRTFLDLSVDLLDGTIYGESVMQDLKAHVWSIITQSNLCIESGVPLKRKVLFAGPYGSGKTIAAMITAQIAVKHGWTVLYLPPTSMDSTEALMSMYSFARLYQPAVVIIEDIDAEQRQSNTGFTYRRNLEAFDGFISKGDQILTIMTTNRPKKIGVAMQRPGRIDTIIDFGRFNEQDIVRLLKEHIPHEMMALDIDWEKVWLACVSYPPAFVLEVAISAKLLAISTKVEGQQPLVTGDMLIKAADDLRDRHKTCQEDLGLKTPPH